MGSRQQILQRIPVARSRPDLPAQPFAEAVVVVLRATDGHHAQGFGKQAVAQQVHDRREEVTLRKVAGSAE